MVTYNDLTIENQNYIQEKARTKADGVYTARGILYRVRDGRVTHVATKGEVLELFGGFNAIVGQYMSAVKFCNYFASDDARELLKRI